jgi:hypothetical protein
VAPRADTTLSSTGRWFFSTLRLGGVKRGARDLVEAGHRLARFANDDRA